MQRRKEGSKDITKNEKNKMAKLWKKGREETKGGNEERANVA